MPLWDGATWHQWLPHDGGLIKIQTGGVVVGVYLAQKAEADSDLSIGFLNFAWQHASWPETYPYWRHMTDDILNFATCVAKLEYFVAQREAIGSGVGAFCQTEAEYLFVTARSLFDLLQELISLVWNGRVRLVDPKGAVARKGRSLPKEFSKIVLEQKCQPRSAVHIRDQFLLSEGLAEAYASAGEFFSRLRDVRDAVVHAGKEMESIFVDECGPSIHFTAKLHEALGVPLAPHDRNPNLLPLWPIIDHVVSGTVAACDQIVAALERDFECPAALAPGHSVFLRGYHTGSIARLMQRLSTKQRIG